jgi:hypothetical protein
MQSKTRQVWILVETLSQGDYTLIDGEPERLPSLSPLPPPSTIHLSSSHVFLAAPLFSAIFLPFSI